MANKSPQSEDVSFRSWLDTNLLLSTALFLCTYIVFGWSIASKAEIWATLLHEQQLSALLSLEKHIWVLMIKLVALVIIILITFVLSTPVALTTFLFEESIHSDFRGFFSILIWSIVLVFAFCSFGYFADFLVIISANILFKLDLQKLKFSNWQIIAFKTVLASMTFLGGMELYKLFTHQIV